MLSDTYHMLAGRQATYWWQRARRVMVVELLLRHKLSRGCRWLDLGCGPGGNLRMLEQFGPALVVGADLSALALSLARQAVPGAALVQADLNRTLPFSDGDFDIVTILNVLYHQWVRREIDVVTEAARVMRPGGLLVLTEPAFSLLSREMDIAAMARRRYRRYEIVEFCRSAGLDVLVSSYFTSFGFPLLLGRNIIARAISRRRKLDASPGIDMVPLPHLVNEMLFRLAALEGGLVSRGRGIPFGTTAICLARKRASHLQASGCDRKNPDAGAIGVAAEHQEFARERRYPRSVYSALDACLRRCMNALP